MPSLYISERKTGSGALRFDVKYRAGGRGSPSQHGGTFKRREDAEHRMALISSQLAAGIPVRFTDLPQPVAYKWIYFVRMGMDGPIKIGVAEDVDRRIRHMQTANPYPLWLMAKMPWVEAEERRLHHAFRHVQLTGEWFRPVDELLAYIRRQADEVHPHANAYRTVRDYTSVRQGRRIEVAK